MLVESASKSGNGTDATERLLLDLARELGVLEFQGQKVSVVCEANKLEQETYQQKQESLRLEIQQAHKDIAESKGALEEARLVRKHNAEYEVLRAQITEQPSRSATNKEISRIQSAMQSCRADEQRVDLVLELRHKQFALLQHYLEDLNSPVDEEELQLLLGQKQQLLESHPPSVTPREGSSGRQSMPMDVDEGEEGAAP
ncbi:MAG: hypothetical protein WDW38_008592 [Sanguina aurantia]